MSTFSDQNMVGAFQPRHLIVVLVLAVMVFGLGKLPELGRAVGDGLRELKRASGDGAATPAVLAPLSVVAGQPAPRATPPRRAARFCGSCGTALARSRAA